MSDISHDSKRPVNKRGYAKPELITFGSVAELTGTKSSSGTSDAGTMMTGG